MKEVTIGTPIKDDTKDSLNSSDSLIESSLKKKGKKSPRLNNSFLKKLLKPTKKSDKEKEPERKKNFSANSDSEGDLINNIKLDEPDHVLDNPAHVRVELLRLRSQRQKTEKLNAAKELPPPKVLFPEQKTITEKQTNRRKAKGSASGLHGFHEMYGQDLNLK